MVLLDVQMHSKQGFRHRLWAQTARFVQLHPQVQHLAVVVVVPHRRLKLGPVQLPQQLQANIQQILELRPDLLSTVLTMVFKRFPTLTPEEIMVIAGISTNQLLHTRAAQDLLDRGREEGREEGEAKVTLRLLIRRCGPLSEATTARIQALPLDQLEALAEALLDFAGADDLAVWLAQHAG